MASYTFAKIVGVVGAVWHFFLGGVLFLMGAFFSEVAEEVDDSVEKDSEIDQEKYAMYKELVMAYAMGFLFLGLIASVISFIVSILLVVGIQKKRPGFVAPWIYINVIAFILYAVNIFFNIDGDEKSKIMDIITCVLIAGIWYPIYRTYKQMIFEQKTPASLPANPHYAPYVPQVAACPAPADFSHAAKYVHTEDKAVYQQQSVYPNMHTSNV